MSLEKALIAARQFGGEAEASHLPSWSKDDRESIAYYYGVEKWSQIPVEDQNKLLVEYRYGENLEAAKDFSSKLFVQVTKDWTPADWEQTSAVKLREKIEAFVDIGDDHYWRTSLWEAALAFERWDGKGN